MSDGRLYPDRPWVGVGVVVWRGEEVLLVRRGRPPRQGEWGIPGGAQQLGETLFEAAVREVEEETGIAIEPTGIVTAVDSIWRDGEGGIEFHYTIVEVMAEYVSGEATAGDDAAEVCWVKPEALPDYIRWSATHAVIEQAARMRAAT